MSQAVLQAIVEAACDGTAALTGWIVARRGEQLVVVAAAGGDGSGDRIGRVVAAGGTAALVAASGQPVSRQIVGDDPTAAGAGGHPGIPGAVLAVPCGEDAALELAGRTGGGAFTIDDIEVATLLARVGERVLAEAEADSAPTPEQLARELRLLASADPGRYAPLARAVAALLGSA